MSEASPWTERQPLLSDERDTGVSAQVLVVAAQHKSGSGDDHHHEIVAPTLWADHLKVFAVMINFFVTGIAVTAIGVCQYRKKGALTTTRTNIL